MDSLLAAIAQILRNYVNSIVTELQNSSIPGIENVDGISSPAMAVMSIEMASTYTSDDHASNADGRNLGSKISVFFTVVNTVITSAAVSVAAALYCYFKFYRSKSVDEMKIHDDDLAIYMHRDRKKVYSDFTPVDTICVAAAHTKLLR